MAYISKSATIVVDAILTKRGRQLLASGVTNFEITKFAVADDEVDYSLTGLQSNISSYYILQPVPYGESFMKYKLYTQNTTTTLDVLYDIQVSNLNYNITNEWAGAAGITMNLTPTTTNYTTQDYTFTVDFAQSGRSAAATIPVSSVKYVGTDGIMKQISLSGMGSQVSNSQPATSLVITKASLSANTFFTIHIKGNKSCKQVSYAINATTNTQYTIS